MNVLCLRVVMYSNYAKIVLSENLKGAKELAALFKPNE